MKNGRKWHKDIVGLVCQGRRGLRVPERGHFTERRALLQREREVGPSEEKLHQSKEACLDVQGACMKWQTESRALTWTNT